MVVYNAGTDILEGDPLGILDITPEVQMGVMRHVMSCDAIPESLELTSWVTLDLEVMPAMSLVIIISDVISDVAIISDVVSNVIKNVLHHMTQL